jgi:hypothetical protein
MMRGVGLVIWFVVVSIASSLFAQSNLSIGAPDTNGWVRLSTGDAANTLFDLQASSNLVTWRSIATTHDGLFDYPDAEAAGFRQRFYRFTSRERVPSDDWKNQILFPTEEFRSPITDPVRWVKFAIVLSDPARVVYQHSTNYPFHYDFARQRLPGFIGMDHETFDAVSLRRTNQQVLLGAVLYPPIFTFLEYGIQFVGLDPYPVEDISRWFELVRATVHPDPRAKALYIPTFEQRAVAEENRDVLEAKGIPVASLERWVDVNHCYASGWAFGRLLFFPASEIDEAYAAGLLRPEDILLTDGVPAETPLVAGIISLTPSTPNSHVAILSASFGIPFVYLPDPDERERVFALAGHEVVVRAYAQFDRCTVDVIDVDGTMSPEKKAELLALKHAPPIRFVAKTNFGAISASTDTLTPADIRFFGGKAANYGLLRQWVPSNAPPAIALSFDVWDAFLDQMLPGGNTLRAAIAVRLAPYTNFPPQISALKADLAAIRDLFTGVARFTPAQQQAITNALRVFNPARKIRFRSSTNVEDSEHFTGAGLYDSYSGCLLDDHDSDTTGPSHCDPTENNERGVFRAIQRVYASFYNDNAFLERLRHGVDETKVGMGVLVHHSFPDEEELANGVATLTFNFFSFGTNISGDLVTQYGATPVTNPDGSAIPEVVDAARFGSGISVELKQHSSLVPLGAYVMDWRNDYVEFMRLFTQVGYGFKQFYPAKNNFLLDFEYKKDLNLGLVVKQVREVPRPPATNAVPFLVDDPVTWCVDQQEFSDAFSNHRLKSLWTLNTKAMRLFPSNLTQTIYRDGALEYVVGTNRLTLTGAPATWPNASNSLAGDLTTDFWTTGSGANQRNWRLQTTLLLSVSSARPPIVTGKDLQKSVMVTYATPVPVLDNQAQIITRTNETVRLVPCRQLHPGAILREQTLMGTNTANGQRVTVQTSYYWPKPPGAAAGYTAPLVSFVETRITGLTTNEIVLHDYYSQTYHPGHHNFNEEFIFEPRLDPGVPAVTVQELNAAKIQFLHIHRRLSGRAEFTILGTDGVLRRWQRVDSLNRSGAWSNLHTHRSCGRAGKANGCA